MTADDQQLAKLFRQLTDEELLARYAAGTLTEEASAVAAAEIRQRQLPLPAVAEPETPAPPDYAGDYEIVGRFLNVLEAQVLCARLEAAGVPAFVADAQLVQTNSLWAPALGGARLLVPAYYLAEAKAIIAAFESGALALGEEEAPDASPSAGA